MYSIRREDDPDYEMIGISLDPKKDNNPARF